MDAVGGARRDIVRKGNARKRKETGGGGEMVVRGASGGMGLLWRWDGSGSGGECIGDD